jgi:hypothetical protein
MPEGNSMIESVPAEFIHTVVFKCIGATKDITSQAALRTARERYESYSVKLTPEPTNIKDSKAICFQCEIDGKWICIGYVVSEILDEVHDAIQNQSIVDVKFAWIKYITDWSLSGPGYFAGISVSKKGMWPIKVTK